MERHGAALVLEDQTVSSASERFEKWPDMIEGSRGIGVGSMVEGAVGAAALAAMHPGSRSAPELAAEIHAFAEALQREGDTALRLISGKMVVEFQPRGADKGAAIAAFLAEPPFLGRRPVFVGDDATDEDGFAEIERRSGIAIRVGPIAASTARYGLPSVAAVLAWLAGRPESY